MLAENVSRQKDPKSLKLHRERLLVEKSKLAIELSRIQNLLKL